MRGDIEFVSIFSRFVQQHSHHHEHLNGVKVPPFHAGLLKHIEGGGRNEHEKKRGSNRACLKLN